MQASIRPTNLSNNSRFALSNPRCSSPSTVPSSPYPTLQTLAASNRDFHPRSILKCRSKYSSKRRCSTWRKSAMRRCRGRSGHSRCKLRGSRWTDSTMPTTTSLMEGQVGRTTHRPPCCSRVSKTNRWNMQCNKARWNSCSSNSGRRWLPWLRCRGCTRRCSTPIAPTITTFHNQVSRPMEPPMLK